MNTINQPTQFRWIPLNELALSPLNVRKTGGDSGIEELACLIEAEGVLQNLSVHAGESQAEGPTGQFYVVAGGRRLRALKYLAKAGRIASDYATPCVIVTRDRVLQISLTENSGREPMHPADEFEAFRALIGAGQSIEDVAARFGVTPLVVRRRLKLANVAPVFLEQYRSGDIGLEQLMALAASDDTARQEQVWRDLPSYARRDPQRIREALIVDELPAEDRSVRFVGLKAYEKAGGVVKRDLFSTGNENALFDRELVLRLAQDKLERQAKKLRDEGISWVEVAPELEYAQLAEFGRVRIVERELNAEELAEHDALRARQEALERELAASETEEASEALSGELDEIADRLEALEETVRVPDPEQQALAGALVSIGHDGKVRIERDLLKPEDVRRMRQAAKGRSGAETSSASHEQSAALTRRLTAHRTLALQAELVQQPLIAVMALTHGLALRAFYTELSSSESPVRVCAETPDLRRHADDLEGSQAAATLEAHRKSLRAQLPEDPDELFACLLKQSGADLMAILAFCVAITVNGVQSSEGPSDLEPLARATGLDMRRWWAVTGASYLASVSKARILEVVTEAVSPEVAAQLSDLKKAALVETAERQLVGKGWLPSILRTGP